jgi:hypothetical protein
MIAEGYESEIPGSISTSPEIDGSVTRLLEQASGLSFSGDYDPFYCWLWSFDPGQHPEYAEFMTALYERIDPSFREYFDARPKTLIRLDEVLRGGVSRDGIPAFGPYHYQVLGPDCFESS